MIKLGTNSIGSLYLGTTKIGKAYLGSNLVYDSNASGGGDISDYVQNGLVMHLDGIDKGQTAGRWTSLVGSTYYTLNSYSTSESNAVLMSGTGVISGTNSVAVTYNAGTIEVCYERISGNIVIYAGSNGLAFIFASAGITFGVASSKNQWNCASIPSLATASVNSSLLFVNGSNIGTSISNNSWGSANAACPIGGRTAGTNRYYANVRIFSIRKYNRKLTQAEMLQNQKVDNTRFHLGLNI